MDEKNLEYREELDRRISILTENGKKDSVIEQLQTLDYIMMVMIGMASFLTFYWGWQ
ncbi:hypothetical protein MHB50_03035 [Siminovitchia sp. FSL H7-0308]|uniref:TMhelix containing protein n=1 Tax=Siminovitchia thermophila TaxID=1245522 RepID=A0ABS2R2S9_9BACI|nr:hypothetical protein [Siminovitchia thermophila]MBM7713951.1 hypothetical protein [Siminovitchia thermophila]